MAAAVLRMSFADVDALSLEFETNLQHGRAFVQGAHVVGLLEDCTLILVHPGDGHELALCALAVFVAPDATPGVGVQLRPFDPHLLESMRDFVHGGVAAPQAAMASQPCLAEAEQSAPNPPQQAGPHIGVASEIPEPDVSLGDTREPVSQADAPGGPESEEQAAPSESGCARDTELEQDADGSTGAADLQQQPSRLERLRRLNQTEQHKLARTGSLNDRVMLERLYGRGVWEALLANPKLTVPEVATIARKGSVPRPLLELIVENKSWTAAPIVRRALLGNPRVNSDAILKLLRLTPKHELKSIHKTNTYSTQVREAARKVLDSA